MTKILKVESPLFLYGGTCLVVVGLYLLLNFALPVDIFIYGFLFRCWPVQFISSWLFMIGLLYWIQRYLFFKKEEEAFQKIKFPEFSIAREKAWDLIRIMPDEYKGTLTLRRVREILQAFSYGEDVIRLNEELSRRDMAEVEQGHSILNSLRNLIPVIGFLGTVIGLSMGMISFPDITNIEILRKALKSFAASLSVAFDTTLLALSLTIVIILLTSFLRHREEILVGKVDERARMLIGKVKVEVTPGIPSQNENLETLKKAFNNALGEWKEEFISTFKDFLTRLEAHDGEIGRQIEGAAKSGGKILAQKLEEIKEGIHRPPHYQIIVQPLNGKEAKDVI